MQCLQVVALNQINHRGVVESGTKQTNVKKGTVAKQTNVKRKEKEKQNAVGKC